MRVVARNRRRVRYAGVALAASLLGAGYLGYGYYEQHGVAQGFATLAALHVDISGDPQKGHRLKLPRMRLSRY